MSKISIQEKLSLKPQPHIPYSENLWKNGAA